MSLHDDFHQVAETIQQALEQVTAQAADNRAGWRDSNAQHTVTQLSLSSMRQEILDGFERLHRRLDAMGVPHG